MTSRNMRDVTEKPQLGRVLWGGALAGATSALVNGLYFLAYRALTRIQVQEPSLASISISSLLPCLLAALGYFALSRLTERVSSIFVALTLTITLASFESVFRDTLPAGALKPAGFDGLVLPMHAAVGMAAALLIPFFARRPAPGRVT
jgi:hypothetical protein